MLRSGYGLAEYVSISQVLRKAPAKYARAYLYTETDEGDTTYFVLYQLSVLQRTIRALHEHVDDEVGRIEQTRRLLRESQRFNHRQLAILSHALGDPRAQYTATTHANTHLVTRQTARTDLKELADLGLLQTLHVGSGFLFVSPEDLERRLRSFGAMRPRPPG
jgi:Fic family protein